MAMLGDALMLAGRGDEAVPTLKAALDRYQADPQIDPDTILDVRQRYGRALLDHGDPAGARPQLEEVLSKTHDRPIDPTVMAQAAMARLLLVQGDLGGAQVAIRLALNQLEHVNGLTDARDAPFLWQVQAEASLAGGDVVAARNWARRALEADLRYDGEQSVYVASVRELLQRIDRSGNAASSTKGNG